MGGAVLGRNLIVSIPDFDKGRYWILRPWTWDTTRLP